MAASSSSAPAPIFNLLDAYTFNDLLAWFTDRDFGILSAEQVHTKVVTRLARCYRRLEPTGAPVAARRYIIKLRTGRLPSVYSTLSHGLNPRASYKPTQEAERVQLQLRNFLTTAPELCSRQLCLRPEPGSTDPDQLNLFPGFRAQRLPDPDLTPLAPLLQHLQQVLAGGDLLRYRYLLAWLAQPIRTGRRCRQVLQLLGPEEAGLDLVLRFFQRYVYGPQLSHGYTDFSELTADEFKSQLAGKYLVYLSQIEPMGKTKISQTTKKRFKALTQAERLTNQRVGKAIELDNTVSLAVCSSCCQLDGPDVVTFRVQDLGSGIPKLLAVVPETYYEQIFKQCFNRKTGNVMLSWIHSAEFAELVGRLDPDRSPDFTEIPVVGFGPSVEELLVGKRLILDHWHYQLVAGEETEVIEEAGPAVAERIFVSTETLYQYYQYWCQEQYPPRVAPIKRQFAKMAGEHLTPGQLSLILYRRPRQVKGYFVDPCIWSLVRVQMAHETVSLTDYTLRATGGGEAE